MRHRTLALAILALALPLGAVQAAADELVQRPVQVLGQRTRKLVRAERYLKNLRADKLRVFEEYGFTPYRLREDRGQAGVIERWRYPDAGVEFTFDAAGRQIERRRVMRGDTSFD